jgi:NitT/TauT family transport system substrate-binding protein
MMCKAGLAIFSRLAVLLCALALAVPAMAAESVNLILNWTPTADHSPFYYAKAKGWFAQAGIDLVIETGKGSGVSAQKVGAGAAAFGIADLATALVARSKGADVVAVMAIYANTAQGFYWLKSSGIAGPKDFPGRKIGNPPGDAARVMWPAFAKAAGIDPASVNFVNISPQAKMPSLKSHAVDIITDFFNEHDLKVREFGPDLGYLGWRDAGLNPYGNSLIVNGAYLEKNPKLVDDFVKVGQKAFATCVADVKPCLDALFAATSGLDEATQLNQWERIKSMMADPFTTTKALGWIDADRMQKDYDLVNTYVGMDKPFDVSTSFTTRFLDPSIRMDASKVKN